MRIHLLILAILGAFVLPGAQPLLAAQTPVVVKVAHIMSADSHMNKQLAVWAKDLESRTAGALKVELYPGGQLGQASQLDRAVQLGTIQMEPYTISSFGAFVPRVQIFDMPFLYRTVDHQTKVMTDPWIRDQVNTMLKPTGVRMMAFWSMGMRSILSREKPVHSISDLRGFKIRVPEIPLFVQTFRYLGANPTPINWGETYTAVQTGIVDGVEATPEQLVTIRAQEVGKHLSLTRHFAPVWVMFVNERWYKGLAPDLQEAVTASLAAYEKAMAGEIREIDERQMKTISDAGVTIIELPSGVRSEMEKAVQPYYEEMYRKQGAGLREIVERIRAVQ